MAGPVGVSSTVNHPSYILFLSFISSFSNFLLLSLLLTYLLVFACFLSQSTNFRYSFLTISRVPRVWFIPVCRPFSDIYFTVVAPLRTPEQILTQPEKSLTEYSRW